MKKSIAKNNDQILIFVLAIVLAAVALWAIGCGGGGGGGSTSGGSPTAPSGGGNIGATVTLTSSGVSDATPRINSGDRVRFVNNDTRARQIMSGLHPSHTECPGLNIGMLSPGASGQSEPLTGSRGCPFHDHMDPTNNRFHGQVLVGLGSGDPPPPTPGYLRR